MSRGTIWLDVDGVLFDYTTAFIKFTGLDKQGYSYENIFDYNLAKLFRGGVNESREKMYAFTKSAEFRRLPVIALQRDLELLFNMGFKLNIITTLPTDPQYKLTRIEALTSAFGPVFNQMVFTDWQDCKLEYITNSPNFYKERNILVEDNPNLLKKVNEYVGLRLNANGSTNFTCYAVKHPYNEKEIAPLENLTVCNDFHSVTNMIAMSELVEV